MSYQLRKPMIERLRELRNRSTGKLVFPADWSVGTFYNRYAAILKRAGLPVSRQFKTQALRRSFASFVEAAGGNATEAMAHTHRRTTERSYIDPTIAVRKSASQLLPEIPAVIQQGGAA